MIGRRKSRDLVRQGQAAPLQALPGPADRQEPAFESAQQVRTPRRRVTGGTTTRLRLAANTAAAVVVVLAFVNVTLALSVALLFLAVAVLVLARVRVRLMRENSELRRRLATPERDEDGPVDGPATREFDPTLPDGDATDRTAANLAADEPTEVRRPGLAPRGAIAGRAGAARALLAPPAGNVPERPVTALSPRKIREGLALPSASAEPARPVPAMAQVLLPGHSPARYLVDANATVGRSDEADVVIDDPTVSRVHAHLDWTGYAWHLVPQRGRTTLNTEVIAPGSSVELHFGDRIRLGAADQAEIVWDAPSAEGSKPPQPALIFAASANTSPGSRATNNDSYIATPNLVGVADGVGSLPAAAAASRRVTDSLLRGQGDRAALAMLVERANHELLLAGIRNSDQASMASTLDIARLSAHNTSTILEVAHIGDGAVYLQQDEGVHLLTTPHRSKLTGGGTQLERALGVEASPEADFREAFVSAGERVVITSDGLVDFFGERQLVAHLTRLRGSRPREVADYLVQTAAEGAGPDTDNLTVVVADIVVG